MTLFQELLMRSVDQGTFANGKLEPLKINQTIQDWNLLLSTQREVPISNIIKNGPLLLIFIRGTWCPFCNVHMKRLREWKQKLSGKNATIVVVSSEPVEEVQKWLKGNNFPYLFACDPNFHLSDYFGVRIKPKDFSQAATFLIDSNMTVRLAYAGKRDKTNFDAMEGALEGIQENSEA